MRHLLKGIGLEKSIHHLSFSLTKRSGQLTYLSRLTGANHMKNDRGRRSVNCFGSLFEDQTIYTEISLTIKLLSIFNTKNLYLIGNSNAILASKAVLHLDRPGYHFPLLLKSCFFNYSAGLAQESLQLKKN